MTDVLTPNLVFPAADAALRARRQGQRGPKAGETDWTPERVATLREMWAAGKTVTDIMIALDLGSRGAVSGKISRLGLSRVKPPPEHRGKTYRSEKRTVSYVSRAVLPEGRLTFEDLTDAVCHFPVGEPPFLFCGEPTKGATYCASCHAIAWRCG